MFLGFITTLKHAIGVNSNQLSLVFSRNDYDAGLNRSIKSSGCCLLDVVSPFEVGGFGFLGDVQLLINVIQDFLDLGFWNRNLFLKQVI